ncbi:hypothetical protein FACS1894217_14240 [Clostridia bacterium]|nr:hypothetical protein FACS1894217_14240 [Clostridia bacterium]
MSAEQIDEERKVYIAQLVGEGKPENIAAKAAEGRLNKYFAENCLLEQAFFKDETLSIQKLVDQKAKELGGEIKLTDYRRFEKGEGIAKREDDFAAEVASLVK